MTPASKFPCLFLFLVSSFHPARSLQSRKPKESFVFPIIHIDSLESPFHQPNITLQRELAHKRSIDRRNYLLSSLRSDTLITPVVSSRTTEFLMKITIGTPPFETMVNVDTGSDTTWFQSSACAPCYEQSVPKFDPAKSSSLRWVECHARECVSLSVQGRCSSNNDCEYTIKYGDESSSFGKLASDTLIMNSTDSSTSAFPQILFGCGTKNIGIYPSQGGGLVGLNGDRLSLISQLGISRRFSYCFKGHWRLGPGTGRLYLGRGAPFAGSRSPLSVMKGRGSPASTYFVTLEDISVDFERLQIPQGTFDRKSGGSGGVIIDSGASYTYLNIKALNMLTNKLREVIQLDEVQGPTPLCYHGTDEVDWMGIPFITFHFKNLDVRFDPLNTFLISEYDLCLAMLEARESDFSSIGSYAQQNMNVGLDLEKNVFTMAPADCTTMPV